MRDFFHHVPLIIPWEICEDVNKNLTILKKRDQKKYAPLSGSMPKCNGFFLGPGLIHRPSFMAIGSVVQTDKQLMMDAQKVWGRWFQQLKIFLTV